MAFLNEKRLIGFITQNYLFSSDKNQQEVIHIMIEVHLINYKSYDGITIMPCNAIYYNYNNKYSIDDSLIISGYFQIHYIFGAFDHRILSEFNQRIIHKYLFVSICLSLHNINSIWYCYKSSFYS